MENMNDKDGQEEACEKKCITKFVNQITFYSFCVDGHHGKMGEEKK